MLNIVPSSKIGLGNPPAVPSKPLRLRIILLGTIIDFLPLHIREVQSRERGR
jgi:hypothetical protein